MEILISKNKTLGTVIIIAAFCALIFWPSYSFAAAPTPYVPLTNLPGVTNNIPTSAAGSVDFTPYVGGWVNLLIGLGAVLAVIMIVLAGVEYMSTDAIYNKSEAKSKIGKALGGLALLIISWLILNTINPNLLNFKLSL